MCTLARFDMRFQLAVESTRWKKKRILQLKTKSYSTCQPPGDSVLHESPALSLGVIDRPSRHSWHRCHDESNRRAQFPQLPPSLDEGGSSANARRMNPCRYPTLMARDTHQESCGGIVSCLRLSFVTAVRTAATNILAAMRQRTRGDAPRRTTCNDSKGDPSRQ